MTFLIKAIKAQKATEGSLPEQERKFFTSFPDGL